MMFWPNGVKKGGSAPREDEVERVWQIPTRKKKAKRGLPKESEIAQWGKPNAKP